MENNMCVGEVHEDGRSAGFHQCCRKGSLEYKGKKYCKTHYPPNEEAKRKEREERWEKNWAERKKEWKRESNQERLISMIKKLESYDKSDFEKLKKLANKC